jgi:hypothetical protein
MNASNGSVQWLLPYGSAVGGIASCGGQVWINNGNLHRIDATSGAETGRSNAGGLESYISEIGTSQQRVFVAGGALVTAFDC